MKKTVHPACNVPPPPAAQARNVLLKSSASETRGVIAKIADFGLSWKIDSADAHAISSGHKGTPTHMAPEVLIDGLQSKASDV